VATAEISDLELRQSSQASLSSIYDAVTSLQFVMENTLLDVLDESVESIRQHLEPTSCPAYTDKVNTIVLDSMTCEAPDVESPKATGSGNAPMSMASDLHVAFPSLRSDEVSSDYPVDLLMPHKLTVKNTFIDENTFPGWVENFKSGPGRLESTHAGLESHDVTGAASHQEILRANPPLRLDESSLANLSLVGGSAHPAPSTYVAPQDVLPGGTLDRHAIPSPESSHHRPKLSRASASELSNFSTDTSSVVCYMEPHSRHTRCRRQFVQSGSVVVNGQRVPLKLFVSPCPNRQMSKNLCFRSPKARLKLELRVDYDHLNGEPLGEGLGRIDIIFSVEGETLQQVKHIHDFAKAPLCTCPVIFDPPPANTTWVVQSQLTPVTGSVSSPDVGCVKRELTGMEPE